MHDIVFPENNENEFLAIAQRLGITALTFAYPNKAQFYTKKTTVPVTNALLAKPHDIHNAHSKHIPAICAASRDAIERGADIVYGFEELQTKEPTHFRASGLNQVLCKLATQKNVRIGLPYAPLLAANKQRRTVLLGRIMQNIAFCAKYNTPVRIASFACNPHHLRAPKDIAALYGKLGLRPEQLPHALNAKL